MKKIMLFLIIFTIAAGFTAAQESDEEAADQGMPDQRIGLGVFMDFGFKGVNKPEGEDPTPALEFGLVYGNSFLEGALDINAMLGYGIDFVKQPGMLIDSGTPTLTKEQYMQILVFRVMAGYNFALNEKATLSAIVENITAVTLTPDFGKDIAKGLIKPGIKFTQVTDAGPFSAQVDIPVAYVYAGLRDYDPLTGLALTLNYMNPIGLALTATGHFLFTPDEIMGVEVNGFTGISLEVQYMIKRFSSGVAVNIPLKNADTMLGYYSWFDTITNNIPGVWVMGQVGFAILPNLQVSASVLFSAIGIEGRDMIVSPIIGAAYQF